MLIKTIKIKEGFVLRELGGEFLAKLINKTFTRRGYLYGMW